MFPSLSALLCFSLGLAAVAYLSRLPTFSSLVLFCAASFVLLLLHGFRASVARAAVTRPFLHPFLSVFNSRLSGSVIGLAASLMLGASWAPPI